MIFTLILVITFTITSGQKCKSASGYEGYCREKDDCFGTYHKSDCLNGLYCCQNTGKSIKRCREYGKYVFKKDYGNALSLRAAVRNVSDCNLQAIPLIVGGTKAEAKEFPHMVAIGYGNDISDVLWLCGGSLISENFVLSAAHCSEALGRGPATFARLKAVSLSRSINSNFQDFKIEERFIHPKYKPPSRYYDIALFKLSHSVQMDGYGRPACLHTTPNELDYKKAVATGWGKLNFNDIKGSEHLMKVTLRLIDSYKCNLTYSAEFGLERGITNSQFCAGELEGGKDACQGDSGGPLQIIREEPYCMYSIIGITSFGKFCAFKNSPGIYTRVSYFVPWIESIVWQ